MMVLVTPQLRENEDTTNEGTSDSSIASPSEGTMCLRVDVHRICMPSKGPPIFNRRYAACMQAMQVQSKRSTSTRPHPWSDQKIAVRKSFPRHYDLCHLDSDITLVANAFFD